GQRRGAPAPYRRRDRSAVLLARAKAAPEERPAPPGQVHDLGTEARDAVSRRQAPAPGERCNSCAQRLRRPPCLAEVPLALLRPGRAVGLHHEPRYPVERRLEGTVLAFAGRLRWRVQGGARHGDGTLDARQRVLGELSEFAGEHRRRGPRGGGGGRLSRRRRRGRRGGRGSGGRGRRRGGGRLGRRRRRGGRGGRGAAGGGGDRGGGRRGGGGPRRGGGRLSRRRRRGRRGGRGSAGRGDARARRRRGGRGP